MKKGQQVKEKKERVTHMLHERRHVVLGNFLCRLACIIFLGLVKDLLLKKRSVSVLGIPLGEFIEGDFKNEREQKFVRKYEERK